MEVIAEFTPKGYPIYYVQVKNSDGAWIYVSRLSGDPVSWQGVGSEKAAIAYAELRANRGWSARVIKASRGESLEEVEEPEKVLPLDPFPYYQDHGNGVGTRYAIHDPYRVHAEFRPGNGYEQDFSKYPEVGQARRG